MIYPREMFRQRSQRAAIRLWLRQTRRARQRVTVIRCAGKIFQWVARVNGNELAFDNGVKYFSGNRRIPVYLRLINPVSKTISASRCNKILEPQRAGRCSVAPGFGLLEASD